MAQALRLAILGGGAVGKAVAAGAAEAGGIKLVAAADLIPDRLASLAKLYGIEKTVPDANDLIADPGVDAVAVCLPTPLHLPIAQAALKFGKHVFLESPPTATVKDAKTLAKAAEKSGKTLLHAGVRRFGAAEQSAKQAIEKGYVGDLYHARATWQRTRGIPRGTGWYDKPDQSGGGAIIDLGLPLIDLLLHLMTPAVPVSAYAVTHKALGGLDVEEAGSVLLRFDTGASAEIAVSWAINQPPGQAGTTCRLSGQAGAIDLYTGQGPLLYRGFDDAGQAKVVELKQPKLAGYGGLLRHFKDVVAGKVPPITTPVDMVRLMQIVEAIYKSAESGKAAEIKLASVDAS